jgi:hypothetical protein
MHVIERLEVKSHVPLLSRRGWKGERMPLERHPQTRQTRIFTSLIRETQAVIDHCGYARVYFAVACEVFPEAMPEWLLRPGARMPATTATDEAQCRRLCKGLMYDYLSAIDEFGYEAVYFGVGCVAFPEAVDPWEGNDY